MRRRPRPTLFPYTTLFRSLGELLPEPLLRVEAPSTAEVTLLAQEVEGESRLVAHLLHYVPQRRADNLDLVEDVIPLHDVPLRSEEHTSELQSQSNLVCRLL